MDTQEGLNLQLKLFLTKKVTNMSSVLDTILYNGKRKAVLMNLMILVTMLQCYS